MSRRVILAHDLGTSSNKAALVAESGEVLATASASYPLLTPAPAWVEQDPSAWWDAVRVTSQALVAGRAVPPEAIAGVAFASQMQCVLPVDAAGHPLGFAMSWLDGRAAREAAALTGGLVRVLGYGALALARWLWLTNGAPSLSGRDPLCRMVWLRERQPDVWARTATLFDAKDYLIFRATGRRVTSYDRGNVTWLMDARDGRLCWSPSLLARAGIPADRLPALQPCASLAGTLTPAAAAELGVPPGLPVTTGAGDVTAATIGAGALAAGHLHVGIGTSAWVTTHVARRCVDPCAYTGSIRSAHPRRHLLIGHSKTGGAAVEWARTRLALGTAPTPRDVDEAAARSAPGAGGVLFAPWLTGEAAPLDDPFVRGGFLNLSLTTEPTHLARAVLEGVALNLRWIVGRVARLAGPSARPVRVAGGGAASDVWCQILADVLGRPVERVADPGFAAARGAALIALVAQGLVKDFDDLERRAPVARRFDPRAALAPLHDDQFARLRDAYRRTRGWFARVNRPG
ncbi:MAG: FGGY-family carbohydrate kinase [Acidobacteriota bacterium]